MTKMRSVIYGHGSLRNKKRFFRVLIISLILLFISQMPLSSAVRTVRVGIFPAEPLVSDKNGKPEGLFIDLIDYFSRTLEWKTEFVEGSWNGHLAGLENGEIDLLPAVGYSDERSAIYDFSNNTIYIDSGVLFVGRKKNVNTVFDINGKRVAAVKGTIFTKGFVDYISSFNVKCDILLTDDNPAVMKAIVNGDVDAGVCIYSLGNELARKYSVSITAINFSPVALKFAVKKGKNADLVSGIDSLMAPMIDDPNSLYSNSFRKWAMPKNSGEIPVWIFWGIVLLASFGIFFGFWSFILKRQVVIKTGYLQSEISERKQAEEKIRKSLEEKDTLIHELYHRTKNTMQVIRGMISLQAQEYKDNSEFGQLVKIMDNRIQAISLVHQMLYKSRDLSRISIRGYMNELSSLIKNGFGMSYERISVDLNIDDQYFVIDAAIPLGLILNELMTNSLKHAFPGNAEGRININLFRNESGNNIFHYHDNGIGVPDGFDFRKQNSLGLKLIYNIGEMQMQGKVVFTNKNGVDCRIEIPMSFYKARV